MKRLIVASVALGLAASSLAFAQEQHTAAPNNANPAMMGHKGSGMMGSMDHAQMQRMMDNCNRMMESRMQPQAPAPEKKG